MEAETSALGRGILQTKAGVEIERERETHRKVQRRRNKKENEPERLQKMKRKEPGEKRRGKNE